MNRPRALRSFRRVPIVVSAIFIVWIIYHYSASDIHPSNQSTLDNVEKDRQVDTIITLPSLQSKTIAATSKPHKNHLFLSARVSSISKPSDQPSRSTSSLSGHHLTVATSTTSKSTSTVSTVKPADTISNHRPSVIPSLPLKTLSTNKSIVHHVSKSSTRSNHSHTNVKSKDKRKHTTFKEHPIASAIKPKHHQGHQFKTILTWTTWFHSDWPLKYGLWKCGQFTCSITNDKQRINDSDALLFHGADSIMNKTSTFRYRDFVPAKQLWVYNSVENPAVTRDFNVRTGVFPFHNNLFNLMMTYTKDADIRLCYGHFVKGNYHQYYDPSYNYAKGKNKLIAWVASTCYSGRQVFVQQLAQYLPIDMYGKCGNLSCTRGGACRQKLTKEYKFYLSLENFICRDYLSEKFFIHSLDRSLVPIVVSGSDLHDEAIAPPGSYINARDFKTLQQLVDYIKLVASDDVLYNSYFQWKASYRYESASCDLNHGICQLCTKLHNKKWVSRKSKTIPNLTYRWGFNKANCVDYGDIFVKNTTTGQIDIKPHQFT